MLLQEPQVMLLLSARLTVTGEPQFGQLKLRPFSSLADSSRRPVSCRSSSCTERPRYAVGVAVP
jgi:hypothetical protein